MTLLEAFYWRGDFYHGTARRQLRFDTRPNSASYFTPEIEVAREYRLNPGHAGTYDIRDIHAIDYPDGARFVRVTGTDLERVPRLKFNLKTNEAEVIESVTTGPG